MTKFKDYNVTIPEGRRATEYDPKVLDGARAALQLVEELQLGEREMEERLFKRDFLPILLGQVEMTDDLEHKFLEAWKVVAGSLQTGIKVVKNGEYQFTVPPLLSAYGCTLADPDVMGSRGIRISAEVIVKQLANYHSNELKMVAYEDAVLGKLPTIKTNPLHEEMWMKILSYYDIAPKQISSEKVINPVQVNDFIEPGEDL